MDLKLPTDDCIDFFRGIKDDRNFDGKHFDYTELLAGFHDFPGREGFEGWKGASINWDLVDGGALRQILTTPKNDDSNEKKYKFGALRIPRKELDSYAKRKDSNVAYELKPEDGNDYHGHILLNYSKLERKRRITICAVLINAYSDILP